MSYNYRAITGSTRISNRPAWMIGGSGLGIGGPPAARRAEQIRAHGRTKHQFSIIKQNTVGGIGGRGPTNSRMFAPTADGVNSIEKLLPRGYTPYFTPFSGPMQVYSNGKDYHVKLYDNKTLRLLLVSSNLYKAIYYNNAPFPTVLQNDSQSFRFFTSNDYNGFIYQYSNNKWQLTGRNSF